VIVTIQSLALMAVIVRPLQGRWFSAYLNPEFRFAHTGLLLLNPFGVFIWALALPAIVL
jgi:hypothetical protein